MKNLSGLAHNLVSVKSTSHRLSHDLSQINSFVWDVAVNARQKPVLIYVLAALIFLEGVALAGATIYLVIEIITQPHDSLSSAIAYAVTAAIAAALVLFVARATLRTRPWIRGATVCIAVLQLLVAYSIVITREPILGWVLAVPAVAMLALLFTRPVLAATARPPRDGDRDERTF